MDNVEIILRYPFMELVGTINVNVQNNFMNIWYKKNKITLKDISFTNQ
jgi:hypothetical protein